MAKRGLFDWFKKAPAANNDVDGAMHALDATHAYKEKMARRSGMAPRPAAALIMGSTGQTQSGDQLREEMLAQLQADHRKPITSHRVLEAYLARVAATGTRDSAFEARSLSGDLRIGLVQVSVVLYNFCKSQGLPTVDAFHNLLPPLPGPDDAIASNFMKVLCASEVGNLGESWYLSILLQGYLSEPDDVDFLFFDLLPHADRVGFVVELCRALTERDRR